jgi:hypothetical protein
LILKTEAKYSSELHGMMTHKIVLFTVTAVRLLIHCLDRERREESKGMKVIKRRKMGVEDKIRQK